MSCTRGSCTLRGDGHLAALHPGGNQEVMSSRLSHWQRALSSGPEHERLPCNMSRAGLLRRDRGHGRARASRCGAPPLHVCSSDPGRAEAEARARWTVVSGQSHPHVVWRTVHCGYRQPGDGDDAETDSKSSPCVGAPGPVGRGMHSRLLVDPLHIPLKPQSLREPQGVAKP